MERVMTSQIVDVQWKDDLTFDAHQQGATFTIMSSPYDDPEHKAVSPKQLLLTSLAGCTAIDVASLLPKMRVPFRSLRVCVEGTLSEDHPKVYTTMHIVYEVSCAAEHIEAVGRAVELSVSKYCGVHAMLAKASVVTHEVQIVA